MNNDVKVFSSPSTFSARGEDESLSTRILNALKELGIRKNKKVSVENEDSPVVTYNFGNESAKIVKRLHDASVGEDGGEIRYYAE